MRLSPRDANIVAHIGLSADRTVPELARQVRVHPHTMRYVIAQLSAQKLISKRWAIDLLASGWRRYEIFFSSSPLSASARQALVRKLMQSERCTYLAEVGGDFDYEVILLARESREALQILQHITAPYGETSFSKEVAEHHRVHYFPRKYLAQGRPPQRVITLGDADSRCELSAREHQLLRLLSESADISQREIAQRCGCSAPTVQTDLQRLRRLKIIRGAMYSFHASHIGVQNYLLLIYARGFGAEFSSRLYQFCIQHPQCTNMKECFGGWDFEIGIEVMHHQALLDLKNALFEAFPREVQSLRLLSRFTTHKYDFYPFRAQPGALIKSEGES